MEGTFNIKVEKKSGALVDFDASKIHEAVKKSASRVLLTFTDIDLKNISDEVIKVLNSNNLINSDGVVTVPDMHKAVELSLDSLGFESVAKSYRDYRNYKEDYVRMMNVVTDKIYQLSKESDKSNANTDSSLVSTKRSLIYSELSSELYKNMFLNSDELEAMNDGYIYIHDRGARLDTFNCCLADIGTIMKGGFTLGPIEYTEPKTVKSAIAVMSDCINVLSSNQYGGLSFMIDDILAPYAEKSYHVYIDLYKDMIKECKGEYNEELADRWAYNEVKNDISQGIQGMEHTFNSVASARGDFPFLSAAFGVNNTRWGKLVSECTLKVRMGGQGKPGHKMPVMFPKLIFLYDENLHGKGKELEELFNLAIECSSKCMYPDFLSLSGNGYVPSMYKKYGHDGIVFPMGCRAFLSPWYRNGGIHPKDDNDSAVFMGRFNMGVVTLNLIMILAKAREEGKDFYEVLDYYLEMIRNISKRTIDYLGKLKASCNPLGFTQGGFYGGYLKSDDNIAPVLKSMTISYGYLGLNEFNELYNGKSLREDGEFPLEVLTYISNKINEYKEEDEILYALYSTPAESLCSKAVEQFRKKYGVIKNVSDRSYLSNSFHLHVSEDVTQIEKQDLEYRFWDIPNGGKIQYCKYPIEYNLEAIKTLVRRAMKMGLYEGVNLDLNYCECGHEFLDNSLSSCPKCGSSNIVTINRMNGLTI